MLRNVLGCTLPIELYHFKDEIQDATEREHLQADYKIVLKEVSLRGIF